MVESTSRLGREANTRDNSLRKKDWSPPSVLPSPTPQEGWVFKWIRVSITGQNDPTNVSARMREGWEPCKAEDHPELMLQSDQSSRFKGNIEVGGLLLCKAPAETIAQRDEYYHNLTRSQIESLDSSFMQNEDRRSNMKLFAERQSSVSFGKGNK